MREFGVIIPFLLKASPDTKAGPVILLKPVEHPLGPLVHTTLSLICYIGLQEILPQIGTEMRGLGDNLFSDSVLAIDPDSGERKWYYQFTPHDVWDYDGNTHLFQVDLDLGGSPHEGFSSGKS